jgi:hypothetical protein
LMEWSLDGPLPNGIYRLKEKFHRKTGAHFDLH